MNQIEQIQYDIDNIFNKKFPTTKLVRVRGLDEHYYQTEDELSVLNHEEIYTLLRIAEGRMFHIKIGTFNDAILYIEFIDIS